MGRFENFTPPTLGSELTTSELIILEALSALANSSAGQFVRKESGAFVNATLAETVALTGLSDVLITSPTSGQVLSYNGSAWVNSAAVASSGANTALSNLASVAINTDLILGASGGGALGSATKMWSNLFLASGAVINFNAGDVTITHASNLLTFAGGVIALGSTPTMTSPDITTSLTTPSTTFGLLVATATTINAFTATTTLNIGASATMILNFGGSTTASEFRFLEPSGSGTNYSAFKAVAQSSNITYSLPPTVGAANTFLTDVAGNGVLTWAGVPAASVLAGSFGAGAFVISSQLTLLQLIATANAITASGNAATVPITSKNNIVTNNSAATLTITLTTGAVNMQDVIVQILDFSAVAQTITWVNTENSTVTAPVTSNGSATLPLTVGFKYNSATSKWRCVASA